MFFPEDYGAVGNGTQNDAAAVQAALDAAEQAGGGTVVLSGGKTYLCSALHLRKNVELHLQKGARLRASSNLADYFRPCETVNDPKTALTGNPVTGKPSFVFLYGFGADGCAISGTGVIDANGHSFLRRKDRYYVTGDFYPRPTTIYIENSRHITVQDVTIADAPFWTLHPAGCDDVRIDGIRILNDLDVANSDGIDPDHCSNVRITNCHITCADDCICLKTTSGNAEYGPCENILISGCTLISTSAAIKIGTEGVGDFRHISVTHCCISKSNRGLSVQIRDGGNVEDVRFSDITIETRRFSPDWWGTAEPIAVTAFPREAGGTVGKVRGLRFQNITCCGENGVLLYGTAEQPLSDIVFENVRVVLQKTTKWENGLYDLRPAAGKGIETHKNAGFFMRYAERVTLAQVEVHKDASAAAFGTELDVQNCQAISRFGCRAND